MNCRTLAGQLRRVLLLCSLLVLCLSTPAHAQLWSGILDPSRAVDWSQAGIPGGIPTRTTICATLNPGATPAQINSAIASCPAGQVVFLTAGTYNISGGITFNGQSNVTLRGAGPDKTFLVFSGSNGCGGVRAGHGHRWQRPHYHARSLHAELAQQPESRRLVDWATSGVGWRRGSVHGSHEYDGELGRLLLQCPQWLAQERQVHERQT